MISDNRSLLYWTWYRVFFLCLATEFHSWSLFILYLIYPATRSTGFTFWGRSNFYEGSSAWSSNY